MVFYCNIFRISCDTINLFSFPPRVQKWRWPASAYRCCTCKYFLYRGRYVSWSPLLYVPSTGAKRRERKVKSWMKDLVIIYMHITYITYICWNKYVYTLEYWISFLHYIGIYYLLAILSNRPYFAETYWRKSFLFLTLLHSALPYLPSSYLTLPYLTSYFLILPEFTSSHFTRLDLNFPEINLDI